MGSADRVIYRSVRASRVVNCIEMAVHLDTFEPLAVKGLHMYGEMINRFEPTTLLGVLTLRL